MTIRISDEQVEHSLTWARNYGDVKSWDRTGQRGAKWLIQITRQATTSGLPVGGLLGARPLDVVPLNLALTSRQVLLFCYGLAIGGERGEPRSKQREEWGWTED